MSLKTKISGCVAGLLLSLILIFTSNQTFATCKPVSTITLTQLMSGQYDNTVIQGINKTGSDLKTWLDAWCRATTNESLETWWDNKFTMVLDKEHANTCVSNGTAVPVWDKKPNGTALTWDGTSGIKEACCQPVSLDKGKLVNFLNASPSPTAQRSGGNVNYHTNSGNQNYNQYESIPNSTGYQVVTYPPTNNHQSSVVIYGDGGDDGRIYRKKVQYEEERNEFKQSVQDVLDIEDLVRDNQIAAIQHAKRMQKEIANFSEVSEDDGNVDDDKPSIDKKKKKSSKDDAEEDADVEEEDEEEGGSSWWIWVLVVVAVIAIAAWLMRRNSGAGNTPGN